MDTVKLQKEEQQRKWIGYGVTTFVHALLLLLLWWAMLHPPDPPMEYGGMELSMALGAPDMGGPNDVPVETPAAAVPTTPVEEQVATQDIEEVPVTVQKKKETPKETTKQKTPVEPVEQTRVADSRSLFKKNQNQTSEGGRGDGVIPGNEGSENGNPDGSPDGNGTGNGQGGTGNGTGMGDGMGSYDLRGRSLAVRPEITDNSRETGRVVVQIVVDRTGRVIKAVPGQKGSTTSSSILWEKAKQGALDARFSPKPDGPEEQYGTMTFVFRFKQ